MQFSSLAKIKIPIIILVIIPTILAVIAIGPPPTFTPYTIRHHGLYYTIWSIDIPPVEIFSVIAVIFYAIINNQHFVRFISVKVYVREIF